MKAGAAWPRAGNKAFKGTLTSPLSPLLSSLTKWPRPPNVRLAEPKVVSPDCQLIARTRGERDGACATNRGGGDWRIFITKNSLQILTVTDGTSGIESLGSALILNALHTFKKSFP